MKDDTSEIETGASCYVVNNANSIYSYKNNSRKTYTNIGGKWYHTATSTYTNIPTNTLCWNYSDITKLNSNAAFEPLFLMIAFCLAIFVWYVVYKLITRIVKWRV